MCFVSKIFGTQSPRRKHEGHNGRQTVLFVFSKHYVFCDRKVSPRTPRTRKELQEDCFMRLCGFRKIYHGGTGVDCTECLEASKKFSGHEVHEENTKVTMGGIKIVDGRRMTQPSGTDGVELFCRSVKIVQSVLSVFNLSCFSTKPSSIKYAESSLNKIGVVASNAT